MVYRGAVVFAIAGVIGCSAKDSGSKTVEPEAAAPAPAQVAEPDESEEVGELDEEEESEPEPEPAADLAEEEGDITFKLHNLCSRTVNYMLAPLRTGEVDVDEPKQLKPGAVEEITAPYGIGVHLLDAKSAAAAATDKTGGHVWISSSCTGVGASNDPNANPKQIDKQLREKIERMTKGAQPEEPANKSKDDEGEDE
jgi:hypothetical protein